MGFQIAVVMFSFTCFINKLGGRQYTSFQLNELKRILAGVNLLVIQLV